MKRKLGIVCDCIKGNNPIDTLDYLKGVGFECFFSDVYDIKTVSALQNKAVKLGLEYQFIHSPYSPINGMWTEGEGYLETVNAVKECLSNASECGIPGVILHVSSGWTPPPMCELGFKRFDELVDFAVKKGVCIAFENLRKPEYLQEILNRYSDVEKAVFCYDCGHEHCFSPEVPIMDKFGHRIKFTHFHDNFGKDTPAPNGNTDLHLLPFDGDCDYQWVIDKLDEFNYTGSIMLETFDAPHGHGGMCSTLKGEAFLEEAYKRATKLNNLSKK